MSESNGKRRRFHSPHASLALLGQHLRWGGLWHRLQAGISIQQKVINYTPQEKVSAVFVGMLAGASSIKDTGIQVRTDPALLGGFGLKGCPEQSTLQDTLDAATEEDLQQMRGAIEGILHSFSTVPQAIYGPELLWLDIDLSPLPASSKAEGSERAYMGRERAKTGRKLLRVQAGEEQEIIWQQVLGGKSASGLATLQAAVTEAERVLGLDTAAQRQGVVIRTDSGFGSEESMRWLLERGYQVLMKVKSSARVRKLVRSVTEWEKSSSPGRWIGELKEPLDLGRPTRQYGVRTPSRKQEGGYQYAVLVTTLELSAQEATDRYDDRAGIENDFKGDKQGLFLAKRRKRKLAAQELLVLLAGLAHNVLIWSRRWLARRGEGLGKLGIVRLVREVWGVWGTVTFEADSVRSLRLARQHPLSRQLNRGLRGLVGERVTLGYLG